MLLSFLFSNYSYSLSPTSSTSETPSSRFLPVSLLPFHNVPQRDTSTFYTLFFIIKQHWNLDWISWYGHSEMCFLAYDESKNNQYKPFFSYGLTENVDGHLVGTSFHNFDMPLIRYDTGDLIASENRKGQLMEAFSITQGRNANALSDSYLIFSCFLYN